MNNEIKQGDKVRVSKDAPRIYTPDWVDAMFDLVLKVIEVEDGNAMVEFAKRTPYRTVLTTIPCKYLVKVEAEAKEARFKKGDKVRYIGNIQEHKGEMFVIDGDIFFNDYYKQWQASSLKTIPTGRWSICNVLLSDLEPDTAPAALKIKVGDRVRCKNPLRLANSTDNDFIGIVTDAVTDGENGWFSVRMNNGATFQTYHESDLELIEPAEQIHQRATIISEGDIHSLDVTPTNNVGSITIPVEVDLTDSYWEAYAADLAKEVAKEVALKIANKFNDPEQAAEYAVKVAKAVVEGLKRK